MLMLLCRGVLIIALFLSTATYATATDYRVYSKKIASAKNISALIPLSENIVADKTLPKSDKNKLSNELLSRALNILQTYSNSPMNKFDRNLYQQMKDNATNILYFLSQHTDEVGTDVYNYLKYFGAGLE